MLAIEGRVALPEEKFNEVSSGYCQESVLLIHTPGGGKRCTVLIACFEWSWSDNVRVTEEWFRSSDISRVVSSWEVGMHTEF